MQRNDEIPFQSRKRKDDQGYRSKYIIYRVYKLYSNILATDFFTFI